MATDKSRQYQKDNIVYGTDPSNVLPRLELDQFVVADKDTLNLFLIAFSVLQKPNLKPEWLDDHANVPSYAKFAADDQWTYRKVANIHGWPFKPWCGVDQKVAMDALLAADKDALIREDLEPESGYCTHGTIVFPTWHRPFIGAYEQMIYNKMQDIANAYTDHSAKEKYLKAAKKFRLPYWDPAMPRNKYDSTQWFGQFGVPTILTSETVNVWTPESPEKLTTIANPFFSFDFQGKTPKVYLANDRDETRFSYPRTTVRNGRFNRNREFVSDVIQFNTNVQDGISTIARGMHRLFAVDRDWSDFSNHARDRGSGRESNSPSLSVESWHDNIHNIIGVSGHMSDTRVAAFDPIFWMHHSMMDRLVAIYQTQQAQTIKASPHMEDTLVFGKGLKIDGKTPLLPFYKAKGQFWTSEDIARWEQFGYTYEHTHYSPDNKPDPARKRAIESYIDSKYTWITEYRDPPPPEKLGFPVDLSGVDALPPDARTGKSKTYTKNIKPNNPDEVYPPGTLRPDGTILAWDAGIRVPKFLLQKSFNIYIFIGNTGDAGEGSANWLGSWSLCGYSGVFVNSGVQDGTCKNCVKQEQWDMIYEDVIPMLMPLRRYLKSYEDDRGPPFGLRTLESLEPDQVIPLLKEYLHVRLDDVRGHEIPITEDMKKLISIEITSQVYTRKTAEHPLGQYGPPTVHRGIDYKTEPYAYPTTSSFEMTDD